MSAAILRIVLYVLLAPLAGGLLDGTGRIVSARMQGRIGPPLLQPFYDVNKLLHKQVIGVNRYQRALLLCYLSMMILSGCIFFAGSDVLMSFFVLSTASTFLYFTAVAQSSPYSTIAANRELIQILSYEPAVLLTCVGFYLAAGSFNSLQIASDPISEIRYLPGFFIAYCFILLIKMRKSPFDISTSHLAHQELVQGVTTELGSVNLGIYHITEWYENIILMGMAGLFFLNSNPWSILIMIAVLVVLYFLIILIDNSCARMKWEKMLSISWAVTILFSGVNLLILMLVF